MVAGSKFTMLVRAKRRFLNLAKFGALKTSEWSKPRTKIMVVLQKLGEDRKPLF